MTTKTWTDFQLTDNMLKQLAAIHAKRGGVGHGAAAGRTGLYNRGLIYQDMTDLGATYGWKTTTKGDEALVAARQEGW